VYLGLAKARRVLSKILPRCWKEAELRLLEIKADLGTPSMASAKKR
jgi:hypothetical protein